MCPQENLIYYNNRSMLVLAHLSSKPNGRNRDNVLMRQSPSKVASSPHLPFQGAHTLTNSWRVLAGRQVTTKGGLQSQPDSTSRASKPGPEDNAITFLNYFLPVITNQKQG